MVNRPTSGSPSKNSSDHFNTRPSLTTIIVRLPFLRSRRSSCGKPNLMALVIQLFRCQRMWDVILIAEVVESLEDLCRLMRNSKQELFCLWGSHWFQRCHETRLHDKRFVADLIGPQTPTQGACNTNSPDLERKSFCYLDGQKLEGI